MTAVEKYFFTPIYHPHSPWSVFKWWESRRLLFNVTVGSAGLISLGTATLFAILPPHPAHFLVPAAVILVYGVMANICYSLGAPLDLLLRRKLGERAAAAGPVLFRYGFVFSLGLTLLPIPLAVLSWVVRWFVH
jgi:hypothetical protein